MKKVLIALSVIAMVGAMTSCKKDGVYNPKEKISRVYEQSAYSYSSSTRGVIESDPGTKRLECVYNWEKKQLSSIDYYSSNGTIYSTDRFSYDGKQISKIENFTTNVTYAYSYDGSKLAKIDRSYNGSLTHSYTIKHDGSKISQIDIQTMGGQTLDKSEAEKMLAFVLPQGRALENIAKAMTDVKFTKGSVTNGSIKLTYDGKNIKSSEYIAGTTRVFTEYEYDANKNPFYGLLEASTDGMSGISQNNVTSERVTENYVDYDNQSKTESYQISYTYTYDGKWPVTRIYTRTDTWTDDDYDDYSKASVTYTETETETTYYEYE